MKLATMRTAGTTAAARIAGDHAVETVNRDPGSLLADDGWKGLTAAAGSRQPTATAHGATFRPLVYGERGLPARTAARIAATSARPSASCVRGRCRRPYLATVASSVRTGGSGQCEAVPTLVTQTGKGMTSCPAAFCAAFCPSSRFDQVMTPG